jgi:NurA-like 5'-3' nuclease
MLKEIYKHAINNRQNIISILNNHKFKDITQKAKENWVSYIPKKKKNVLYGIDSSYNSIKFQGLELWAVDAVSIKITSDSNARLFDMGLGKQNDNLGSISSKMEIQACEQTIDLADLVLMDGSIYSHFTTKHTPLRQIKDIITKKDNVVFISKTSNSNMQFSKFYSMAADIFYYNHATRNTGFSNLFVDETHGKSQIITTTYARLNEDTPIMKIELMGGNHTEKGIMLIMDSLISESVGGYPRSLAMAHDECKISTKDLRKLVSLFGISNEIGSRDLLE